MAGFAYRCMKCRTRNTLRRLLEDYKRQPKCKCCGHWRFYWDKERNKRSDYCSCPGYHYTHREGSPFCHHNPHHEFNVRTRRYVERPIDVLLDKWWDEAPQYLTLKEAPF